MNRVFCGLGSNLGDREAHLRQALGQLARRADPVRISSLYESEPVGGPEQPRYLNAVVELATGLEPEDLLAECQALEVAAGRIRAVRWGPRPLDLDVLWYDGRVMVSPRLVLPHPRAAVRRFVLEPWCEIWPMGSLRGQSLIRLLDDVQDQPVWLWKKAEQWIVAR